MSTLIRISLFSMPANLSVFLSSSWRGPEPVMLFLWPKYSKIRVAAECVDAHTSFQWELNVW